MKRVTIEDVARASGVSRQTVSRAINNKQDISPVTRERVMEAVRSLGYRPNRLAQGMVTQRTRTIGLMVANITNPFYPELARGVQDAGRAVEYNTLLCNTDDDAAEEMHTFRSLMAQGVDGIIAFAYKSSDDDLLRLADVFRPIVLINRLLVHPNICSLMVDNTKGAQLAVETLIGAGHRVIGMLTNVNPSFNPPRRVLGYLQTLRRHGLGEQAEAWIAGAEPTLEGGYAATQQLLADFPTMTAVFAYNDLMALGALRACRDAGRRVPEDMAIIGYDDVQLASMVTPSLSTVYVDKYDIGRKATERLLEMLDKPDEQFRPIEVDVSLVLRETTASTSHNS